MSNTTRRPEGNPATTIYLYKSVVSGCWTAWFNGPKGAEIKAILGSDCVPTPYLNTLDAEDVRGAIQMRNPDCVVCVL